jgi:3,4-dihydroxyphenylacetate 2,3-dioxygenase
VGDLVLAAKTTHVPSMFLSELPGPNHGCRQAAIDGHREIGRRARQAGADTFVVLDTHWLANSGYHINANPRHRGTYTSTEFPQLIREHPFDYPGATDLGHAIAGLATERGVRTMAHDNVPSLGLEYGTLVPMKYMNAEDPLDVLSISGWLNDATFEESRIVGQAIHDAIMASDRRVALLASGSMSHRIWPNKQTETGMFEISRPFNEHVDKMVLGLWTEGRIPEFLALLADYANHCSGEGHMHDTAMLLGALGWDQYQGQGEIITDWFPSSGTGQCNVVFPVPAAA